MSVVLRLISLIKSNHSLQPKTITEFEIIFETIISVSSSISINLWSTTHYCLLCPLLISLTIMIYVIPLHFSCESKLRNETVISLFWNVCSHSFVGRSYTIVLFTTILSTFDFFSFLCNYIMFK